jgi:3-deoxy-D-manno-octulosonate 8-phosphate phosphatase (KDO 8-P phosphatase)
VNLLERFSNINTFVFDVDGVMTDGTLLVMGNNEFLRTMDIKDGYALQLAVKKKYNVFVITGSSSTPVEHRLAYLGITEFHQKISNKKECLNKLLLKFNLTKDTVLFMGDDMPDIDLMQNVALSCCPSDAAMDVLKIANYISPQKGGKGCVRDVIEKVMKLQNKWIEDETIKSI